MKQALLVTPDQGMVLDRSCGVNSDPLPQLARVFSAMTNDADRSGGPNDQFLANNESAGVAFSRGSWRSECRRSWGFLADDECHEPVVDAGGLNEA